VVSPFALTFNDDNYYLVAFDNTDKKIKHYRVDKIKTIKLLRENREGIEHFKSFDIATYSNRTFGMYGGVEEWVTLLCANKMVGVMIDRFGKDIDIRKIDDKNIRVRIKVALSGQFFGWLAGVGKDVTLLEPEDLKKQFKEYLEEILKNYKAD
jgi:predicted DNA-binding transcriptional regulator YafY